MNNLYCFDDFREMFNNDPQKSQFAVTAPDGTSMLTLMDFELYLFDFFGDRHLTITKVVTLEDAYAKFKTLWTYYKMSRLADWSRMYEAYYAEYNPLYNKDAHIEHTTVKSGSESDDTHKGARTDTDTAQVAPFNSETYQNDTKNTVATGEQDSDNTHTYNDVTDVYTAREYGNIGVTQTSELIENEMQLRDKFNLEQYIITDFVNHFSFY